MTLDSLSPPVRVALLAVVRALTPLSRAERMDTVIVIAKAVIEGWNVFDLRAPAPVALPAAALGAPGVRDPANPCADYAPGTPGGDCESDGHYLCRGCSKRVRAGGGGTEEP